MKLSHKQIVPTYPCSTVILGAHGVKGGSGKSTAMANTAMWIKSQYPEAKIIAADIDVETSTFGRLTGMDVIQINRDSLHGLAKLIELAIEGDSDVILFDSPASSLEHMSDFYDIVDADQLEELGIRIACHCVFNPAPDAMKTAVDWLRKMPGWMINTAYFNRMNDIPESIPKNVIKIIEDNTAAGMWMPQFDLPSMQIMDELNLTFAHALELNLKWIEYRGNKVEQEKYTIEGLTNYVNQIRLRSLVANMHYFFEEMSHILLPDQLIKTPSATPTEKHRDLKS